MGTNFQDWMSSFFCVQNDNHILCTTAFETKLNDFTTKIQNAVTWYLPFCCVIVVSGDVESKTEYEWVVFVEFLQIKFEAYIWLNRIGCKGCRECHYIISILICCFSFSSL